MSVITHEHRTPAVITEIQGAVICTERSVITADLR